MAAKRKIPLIKNYRQLRATTGLNQSDFWGRIGVTQSAGSRIESGRKAKKSTAVLAHLVYVEGIKAIYGISLDARDYK